MWFSVCKRLQCLSLSVCVCRELMIGSISVSQLLFFLSLIAVFTWLLGSKVAQPLGLKNHPSQVLAKEQNSIFSLLKPNVLFQMPTNNID